MAPRRLICALLVLGMGCASSQTSTAPHNPSTGQEQAPSPLTLVDLGPYERATRAVNEPVEADAGAFPQAPSDSGAGSVPMLRASAWVVGTNVIGPWNGVCLNEPAINHIAVSYAEGIRTTRTAGNLSLANLGALAIRDISVLQSDTRLLRETYEARVRARDIELRSAERVIETLQRTTSSSPWVYVGLTAAGIALGVVASAVVVLSQ